MKKVLKILVPILLALLIIASLFWYTMVYDRGFTRDVLLKQARFFADNGNPNVSSWFYDLAYEYTGQDENVAIELANQYKAEGNYTKAEFTLSNAIADGGTVELYAALCDTYVEQDKLLDAVNMLDNITNAQIKQELDALRPAAPVADPLPGFYSQYISVSFDGIDETIYYSVNGEYPSIEDYPYTEPIELDAGETKIYAIAVSEDGLVSPLTTLGYTIGGVIEEAVFADPAMQEAVCQHLGVDADTVLYTNQLWNITAFSVPYDAESLEDLALLPYLEKLYIDDMRLESLQFLNSLTNLKSLSLTECRFPAEDVAVFAALPYLEELNLTDCGLSTIAGLENTKTLRVLNLNENTLRNLEPLSGLISLKELYLSNNAVTDLGALMGLSGLEVLDLSYNSITNISPLAACVNLTWLDASHNGLTALGSLDLLSKLEGFYCGHNQLTDISILAGCTALEELDISNNDITDITALGSLTGLRILDFSYNEVTEIPTWSDGSALYSIDGSYNFVASVASLQNQHNLAMVYMDYNQITSVTELADCFALVQVNVYGNAIGDVTPLTERSIVVNYDPTIQE